jgi:hypothetical protein
MIATVYDDAVERHLRGGGRDCAGKLEGSFARASSLKVMPRAGSDLDGNWVTNFNWIKRDAAPFRDVAFAPLLGLNPAPQCHITLFRTCALRIMRTLCQASSTAG